MKPYRVTDHAIDRAVERLGKERCHARGYLQQLMQTAVYTGDSGKGRIFDHYKTRTRLVLDRTHDTVITVYSMDADKPSALPIDNNAIISKARDVIKRELSKFRRQFTKETRSLTIECAELNVEIAQLTLNKARAKSPITQDYIQAKIFALQGRAAAINERLTEMADEYEQVCKQAESFI